MILYLDFRNQTNSMALIGDGADSVWVTSKSRGGAIGLFASLEKKRPDFRRRMKAVVAAFGEEGRKASWSTVRTAVSAANTAAFALDVPVAQMEICEDPKKDGIESMIRLAAKAARKRKWVRAKYSGEPNITKPKA